ncbi:hypothetical protein SAMN05518682_0265 [Cellulosimicrobium aquatile]|uniref:Uncharacterized protein n=1 Tax=Cellulosimicrobium aquatile TaxID=1612203 RepID=A0A1N6N8P0_9MICO|nr:MULTISPECIES: hypothetical protein [Cellulosimicrobium]MCM3533603.1 hypothetical protein [Cellulosimicrobium funkei]MDQ8041099.1 hypothetical protein [Cellulosimicrobium sp. XJ-DQ-B-000]SIP88450.1 hypothetical protein SAMN05518682_0265 [Cellulosimicrobium aquatile]
MHQPDQPPEDTPAPDADEREARPAGSAASWEQVVARFHGAVAEVDDPLTWGLDLDEETLTGAGHGAHDPAEERFLRSYVSFTGETLDVETLRVRAAHDEQAEDIARTALSGALAAPLHSDTPGDDDFLDSYQEYRAAMRAIVEEVDVAPVVRTTFRVDGETRPCLYVTVREHAAAYVPVGDRALVVSGPADLLARVDVVTRPLRNILQDEPDPRF